MQTLACSQLGGKYSRTRYHSGTAASLWFVYFFENYTQLCRAKWAFQYHLPHSHYLEVSRARMRKDACRGGGCRTTHALFHQHGAFAFISHVRIIRGQRTEIRKRNEIRAVLRSVPIRCRLDAPISARALASEITNWFLFRSFFPARAERQSHTLHFRTR